MQSDYGEIWLVRHGQTAWSTTGRHTGGTDIALTSEGRREARSLNRYLSRRSFKTVLVSPLRRAEETCRLAGYTEEARIDPNLREWNYGEFEGKTTPEIRERHPDWDLWKDEIPGGEALAEVVARASKVLESVERSAKDVLIFSHGDMIRVIAALWLGWPPETGRSLALDTASVSILGFDEGNRTLLRWNVVAERCAEPLTAALPWEEVALASDSSRGGANV